jgi:hypothetical protein
MIFYLQSLRLIRIAGGDAVFERTSNLIVVANRNIHQQFFLFRMLHTSYVCQRVLKNVVCLDLELAKIPPGSQYDDARSQWYSRIFNSVDWLSFMINEKIINDKKMIEYMKPDLIRYYEDTFLKNASADERDSNSYQEFKKLYRTIKK